MSRRVKYKSRNVRKYKQGNTLILGAINQDLQKLSAQAKAAMKRKIAKFVCDLCIGIYNNSPKFDEAPYAQGQYSGNTRLLVSASDRSHDASYMKSDRFKYALQDMNLQPNLGEDSILVQGYHRFLNYLDTNGIPELIRIINDTKNPDTGYRYQENVESLGWKGQYHSTSPYQPFAKGLQYAMSKSPDFATFITVDVSTGEIK